MSEIPKYMSLVLFSDYREGDGNQEEKVDTWIAVALDYIFYCGAMPLLLVALLLRMYWWALIPLLAFFIIKAALIFLFGTKLVERKRRKKRK